MVFQANTAYAIAAIIWNTLQVSGYVSIRCVHIQIIFNCCSHQILPCDGYSSGKNDNAIATIHSHL